MKKTPEEKTLEEKDLHLYLKTQSGTVFSPCLCKSTSWFLLKRKIDSKVVISKNCGLKNINELHQTTPSTKTWYIYIYKNVIYIYIYKSMIYVYIYIYCSIKKSKILNFLLTIIVSCFLFFRYVKISTRVNNLPLHKRRIYLHFEKFFSSSFSFTSNT